MKSLMRKMARGQGGFTLVELLVVVAILGIIAAVAVLAVTKFIGTGSLEAAKTELHQAQTAVAACMADVGSAALDPAGVPPSGAADRLVAGWNGQANVTSATVAGVTSDANQFIHGLFKASYIVEDDGDITGVADPTVWGSGVTWDDDIGQWAPS